MCLDKLRMKNFTIDLRIAPPGYCIEVYKNITTKIYFGNWEKDLQKVLNEALEAVYKALTGE